MTTPDENSNTYTVLLVKISYIPNGKGKNNQAPANVGMEDKRDKNSGSKAEVQTLGAGCMTALAHKSS